MNSRNEVFEYLIDQLRQQVTVVDVMGEIKRWSIDRSIAGRGNYTDEENVIIDTYIDLEHNPYKQQCEDLAHEVLSLKNQLRDASAQIKELHKALAIATGDVDVYKLIRKSALGPEQSGRRKEDAQECRHEFVHRKHKSGLVCFKCGVCKECEHEWQFYGVGFPCMCLKCGLKK